VIAALATSRRPSSRRVGGERPELMHLYSGEAVRLALFPNQRVSTRSSSSIRRTGFCAAAAVRGRLLGIRDRRRQSALVITSQQVGDVAGPPRCGMAEVERRGLHRRGRVWYASDSLRSADRGVRPPASRWRAARRIDGRTARPTGFASADRLMIITGSADSEPVAVRFVHQFGEPPRHLLAGGRNPPVGRRSESEAYKPRRVDGDGRSPPHSATSAPAHAPTCCDVITSAL